MHKIVLAIFISLFMLTACSSNQQFGARVIANNADSNLSKQAILKIKSLDTNNFEAASFTGTTSPEIKYRLFKPTLQRAGESYPLVVVYHGSGAIGTDNTTQVGLLQKLFATAAIQQQYPAYVLAPQFATRSSDYKMDTARKVLYATARPALNTVLQLIDSLKTTLNIDGKRIYVIGFSMGGSTVINSLSTRPDLFAAGISISGIPQFDKINELRSIPLWLIHGLNDTENPINSDVQLYKELGNKTRFWKLTGTTHDNVFTTKLLGDVLPKWLFKQHKN